MNKKEEFRKVWLGDLSESEQEDAVKALESVIAEEIALAMADIVEPPKSKPDTITIKALRKRGTDMWYWYDVKWYLLPYPESVGMNISIDEVKEYYKYAKYPLPADAELVTIECRIKTIEP